MAEPNNSFESPDEAGAFMQFVLNRAMGYQGSCQDFQISAVMADADLLVKGMRNRLESMAQRQRLAPIRSGVINTPPGSGN